MDEISAPRIVEVDPSRNLNDLLAERVAADPSAPMVERRTGPGGSWEALSAREFDAEVVAVAKGFVARGVRPGDRVGIMSRTRYEWTLLDWASWAAGAVPVPLYETSSAEQVQWILSDADVRLLVVETEEHAATVAEVRDRAPSLTDVLVIDSGAVATLVAEGADVDDAEIARRRASADLADLATIIYTSGTTGRPKGAELTHENFYSLTVNAVEAVPEVFKEPGGRTLLFMPLAHVFARFIGVLVVAGGTVLGHTPDTRTLLEDLGTFRPTYLLSVPRVFEKVYNSSEQKAAAGGKLRIFHWAVATAIAYSRALDEPKGPGVGLTLRHKVADALVYKKLRHALGGQAKYAVSGGAPLGERLGHFYRGIGVRILEGYGLTETTAPTCVNRPASTRIGTVGTQLPGCAVRIAEDGEILLKGHHVFRGYHNNEQATREALVDGWFRTGDLGSLDDDGYLRITGRKKDLIITSSGKNITPSNLEAELRESRWISQAVVYGDAHPYLVAMLTLDAEEAPSLAGHLGIDDDPEKMAADPRVRDALQEEVDRVNADVARIEQIKRFGVLERDLTLDDDELTPTLKVKRNRVYEHHRDFFEHLYDG